MCASQVDFEVGGVLHHLQQRHFYLSRYRTQRNSICAFFPTFTVGINLYTGVVNTHLHTHTHPEKTMKACLLLTVPILSKWSRKCYCRGLDSDLPQGHFVHVFPSSLSSAFLTSLHCTNRIKAEKKCCWILRTFIKEGFVGTDGQKVSYDRRAVQCK